MWVIYIIVVLVLCYIFYKEKYKCLEKDVDETCEEMYELDDSDLYEIKKMGRTLSRIIGLER